MTTFLLPGRVTLRLGMIPEDWAVDHEYADRYDHGHYGKGIRWRGSINPEAVIFHYLNNRRPPRNHVGRANEQFEYPRGFVSARVADRRTRAVALAS